MSVELLPSSMICVCTKGALLCGSYSTELYMKTWMCNSTNINSEPWTDVE